MADGSAGGSARVKPRGGARRPRRRTRWRWLEAAAMVVVTLVFITVAVAGMLYVRLTHGPIAIKPLAQLIEREINEELSGIVARIDNAEIAYTDGRGFELRLNDLTLVSPAGDVVVSVPLAAVELSGPALRSMRLVPSRIDLIEPRLALVYTEAAGLALDIARGRKLDDRLGGPTRLPGNDPATARPAATPATAAPIDFGSVIAAAAQRARGRVDGAQYLREIGVRDATVTLDNNGALSEWRIVEGSIDLDHSKRESILAGRARIASSRGPWTVDVKAVEAVGGGTAAQGTIEQGTTIEIGIRDLHPRVIGVAMPQLAALEPLDAPATARIAVGFSGGKLSAVTVALETRAGSLIMPGVADAPVAIEKFAFDAGYRADERRLTIDHAAMTWGGGNLALRGSAATDATGSGWEFGIDTTGGQLSAEEFGVAPQPVRAGRLQGRYTTANGKLEIDRLMVDVGGAELVGTAGARPAGPSGPGGGYFDAKLSATTIDRLKAIWPRGVASGARTWIGDKIKRGAIKSATLKFQSGIYAREAGGAPVAGARISGATGEPRRLSLALEAADVVGVPIAWLPPVEAPRLLVRLENNTIEVNIPDAAVSLGPNRRVPFKTGRFAATDLDGTAPAAEVTFRTVAGLVPVLEVLDASPLKLLRNNGISTDGLDGKVDGQIRLSFPLVADLLARDIAIEAKTRVTDGRAKQVGGAFDVQAAAINVDVTPAAVDAQGTLLINGVQAKLSWQRILEDTGERQPPLRLSATLDNADRNQLGIDINHLVNGDIPVEILVERSTIGEAPAVKLRADLTPAEISFEAIAWRKPPGRPAVLQADVVRGKTYKVELQNLKITGDDLAMQGWAGISADNKLREIGLDELTLNVVSKLEVKAVLKSDGADKAGLWQVKVKGRTFDGRDLFRSLISVGGPPERGGGAKPSKTSSGMDLHAEVDNVLGHNDVVLRGLDLKLSRRGEKLVSLDARGTLDGGAPLAVAMTPVPGQPRTLLADTTDAGQAFRLIGFYPNIQGGRGRIEVNVDGQGAAEKTGTLWVDDFHILGDPVLAEVLAQPLPEEPRGGAAGRPRPRGPRAVRPAEERQKIPFHRMKVPFSVGHGQFVINKAYIRGPLQGLEVVGKVDFKLQTLNIGGTFIPLQDLNRALGDVPLFGDILTPSGVFGLTFAVQGPLSRPEILVNPLSVAVPGIFRELMQMTNPNPRVVPREEKAPPAPVEKRTRATTPEAVAPQRATEPARGAPGPQTGGGWTSQVQPVPPAPKPVTRRAKPEPVDGPPPTQ